MNKLLKFKSKFYQYTGVYLAHKETLGYLESNDFWYEFSTIKSHPENDIDDRDIQGLLIGSWQAEYGFYRRMDVKYWLTRNKFLKVYSWFRVFGMTLVSDLERIFND